MTNTEARATAIVCGAGMAGLLSARVLADFYDRVVIVERDELTDEPAPRKGVPQGNYLHTLLVGGQRMQPRHAGVGGAPAGAEAAQRAGARRASDRRARHLGVRLGRPLDRARRPCPTDGRRRATVLPGDVVVDATGRTSAGPTWLRTIGYRVPEEDTVNGFWGYACRNYRMPGDWAPDWAGMLTVPTGRNGDTRGAGWTRQEHNRWLVTLIGCAKDYPPRDEPGFTDWLTALPQPDFAEPLAGATPLDDIVVWRQTGNRLRRYDRLERRPANLLFTGDSVCALNPVYAQGMSVACLGARELREALSEGDDDLAGRFQRRFADALRFSWAASTAADHAVPGAEGDPPDVEEAELGRRWQQAALLTIDDPEAMRLFWETLCLVRGPDWLYTGPIAERVAR